MKRIISLGVSLIILAVIYSKIDFYGLIQVFQKCNRAWMAISLGMVVPLTLLTSWRLQQLMPNQERTPSFLAWFRTSLFWTEKSQKNRVFTRSPLKTPDSELGKIPTGSRLGFGEANRLILAASTLNMVLPSKMGDIAKAYFMRDKGHLSGSLSLSLVVFEKACDMLSLLLWCVFGLMFYPQKDVLFWLMTAGVSAGLIAGVLLLSSRRLAQLFFVTSSRFAPKKIKSKLEKLRFSWAEMHDYFWSDQRQLAKIAGTSIFIWFCHLLQIWFFILALNAWTPFLANLALSPLAILAGLLPLTFAGVGTRDAALIWFYQPYFNSPTAAALGLLCTSRYLIPAIAGLPFLGQYMATVRNLYK